MNLHEYQSKRLFKEYGVPVPKGIVVQSVDEAVSAVLELETDQWMVKAQVHAGGRGQAGGIRRVETQTALSEVAQTLLHSHLATAQTDTKGALVNELLIEELYEIEKEFYVSFLIDRALQKVVFLGCSEGGVEIEDLAKRAPEKIMRLAVDPLLGVTAYQCREMAFAFGLAPLQVKQFVKIGMGLGRLLIEKDLALIEVNPLVLTKNGELLCLDAKIQVDDNALYRQMLLRDMRDPTQEDKQELWAREWSLSYIALDGQIGCMINGAGLAMATLDLIKLQGGEPANFLDVGGSATAERVREGFKIILSDPQVQAILINIFGGIVRCDLIAEGIIEAVASENIDLPVVVRLEGNRQSEAYALLEKSGLNIIAVTDFAEATKTVVQLAKKRSC